MKMEQKTKAFVIAYNRLVNQSYSWDVSLKTTPAAGSFMEVALCA